MFTIAATPFKFHSFTIANFVAKLVSHFDRKEEVCLIAPNNDLLRAYRCGYLYFNNEEE